MTTKEMKNEEIAVHLEWPLEKNYEDWTMSK